MSAGIADIDRAEEREKIWLYRRPVNSHAALLLHSASTMSESTLDQWRIYGPSKLGLQCSKAQLALQPQLKALVVF